MLTAKRSHEICAGHRVHGHENKCAHLHGHNYVVTFTVRGDVAELDKVGRVIDFSVIKSKLCQWLEDNWDHKFLAWRNDPVINDLIAMARDAARVAGLGSTCDDTFTVMQSSLVRVDFNPTAENMARHLGAIIGPAQLLGTGCTVIRVDVSETGKCSATWDLDEQEQRHE